MVNVSDLKGIECLYGVLYVQVLCYEPYLSRLRDSNLNANKVVLVRVA